MLTFGIYDDKTPWDDCARHHSKGKPGKKIAELLDYDGPNERLQFFEPVSPEFLEDIMELVDEPPFARSLPV